MNQERPGRDGIGNESLVDDGHLDDMDAKDPQLGLQDDAELVPSDSGVAALRGRVAAWAEHRAWLENVQAELDDPLAHYRKSEQEAVDIVAELANVYDRMDESTPPPEGGRSAAPRAATVLDLHELASELLDDLAAGSHERTPGLPSATDVNAHGNGIERVQERGVGMSESRTHRLYNFPAATTHGSTADPTATTEPRNI